MPLEHPGLLKTLVAHGVPFVIIGGHAVNFHGYPRATEDLDLFDFVPGVPDADVRQVFDESVPLGEMRYVSLPWLKRMKQATRRPRDIDDLEQLG